MFFCRWSFQEGPNILGKTDKHEKGKCGGKQQMERLQSNIDNLLILL